QSIDTLAEQVAFSSYLVARDAQREKDLTLELIIACYRDRISQSIKQASRAVEQEATLNLEQTGNIRALMTSWCRRSKETVCDSALMAYVLGTAAYESNGFRTRRQSLYYTSAERILRTWRSRFNDIPPTEQLSEIEKKYVGKPLDLAEKVYGGHHGNDRPGDGWRYRGRGLALVTYKDNYRKWGDELNFP